jgi:hypothetical protein
MSNKKQTAVEWLVEQLEVNNYISENAHWLIDEAKEMEKQQIIEACHLDKRQYNNAEHYYNETFNSEENENN